MVAKICDQCKNKFCLMRSPSKEMLSKFNGMEKPTSFILIHEFIISNLLL